MEAVTANNKTQLMDDCSKAMALPETPPGLLQNDLLLFVEAV
jgi:hypothetical protein